MAGLKEIALSIFVFLFAYSYSMTFIITIKNHETINEIIKVNDEIISTIYEFSNFANKTTERILDLYYQILDIKKQLKCREGLIYPTYEELLDFVMRDDTNYMEYSENFTCVDFTNRFIKNFASEGYFSCMAIEYITENSSHSLVAVRTSDGRIWYVEPQTDVIMSENQIEYKIKSCFS